MSKTITPQKILDLTNNVVILDVRTRKEYQKSHLKNAINIPLDKIVKNLDKLQNKKVFVYCKSGKRSAEATKILIKVGLDAVQIAGGLDDLIKAGGVEVKSNLFKNLLLTLWLIVLSGAVYTLYTHDVNIEIVQAYMKDLGWIGVIIYIIAYTIRPLILFPTSIMTPLSAVIFGPYLGWIFTYVGENLSAVVAFLVARYFGRNWVNSRENKLIKNYDKKLTENGFETILFLRMTPIFPFDFVNYSAGLSGIPLKSYIIGNMIGVIPGLTAYIFIGGSILDPKMLPYTIGLFIFIILLARFLKKKYGRKYTN